MTYYTALKNFVKAQSFSRALITLGICLAIVLIFEAGVMVGIRKATFSYAANKQYFETMNGPRGMMPMGMRDRDFSSSHGAVGKIVSITLPTIIVENPDGSEKTITLSDKTAIRRFKETLKDTDLTVDDFIITLGSPQSSGSIDAKLIRVVPSPEEIPLESRKQ